MSHFFQDVIILLESFLQVVNNCMSELCIDSEELLRFYGKRHAQKVIKYAYVCCYISFTMRLIIHALCMQMTIKIHQEN